MKERFVDLFEDCTSQGTKIKTDEYHEAGKYAIVDQGQNDIAGYTDKADGVYEDIPAIIFGDHTRVIKYIDRPFFLGADGVKLLKCRRDDANYKYLYYALKCAKIPDTGYNRHFKWLKEIEIEYPDLEKQQKIVDILDKVEGIVADRKRQVEELENLIKARFIEMFGNPVENPKSWDKKQLQEIVSVDCTISYGIVQAGDDQEEGVPVFRPIDIVNRTPILKELKKTTKEISDRYKRTVLTGRELLITVRANIADTCIVGKEFRGCNVGRGIVPIRTDEEIMTLEFLKHQIDNKHLNDRIKSKAKGITLIQLNMEDLRAVELIVPPIELQEEFIYFAEQTNKSKLAVEQSIEKLESLKRALMQQYF